MEAAVRDLSGQSSELDVELPPEFVLEHVGADGLVSSCRPAPGRIHLELAGIAGGRRGYLPKLTTVLVTGTALAAAALGGAALGDGEV